MSNTRRDGPAYIVLGVKCFPDGRKELLGLSESIDDAELQSKVANWVYPCPRFTYEPVSYSGKIFGIIIIPVVEGVGPFYFVGKNVQNTLVGGKLYFRLGSMNSIASQEDQKDIYAWFLNDARNQKLPPNFSAKSPWDSFLESVDYFDPRRSLVLALSRFGDDENLDLLSSIGEVDWYFVVDFDPSSQVDGTLSKATGVISRRRALHVLTKNDSGDFSPFNATYWYMIRGLSGVIGTLVSGGRREWNQQYHADISKKTSELADKVQRPVTLVIAWYSTGFVSELRVLLDSVSSHVGEGLDVVIVTSMKDMFSEFVDDYEARIIEMPAAHFLGGIQAFYASRVSPSDCIMVPTSSGANVKMEDSVVGWLREELEIVHPQLGLRPSSGAGNVNDFLRGRSISWFDLALRLDVERDLTNKVMAVVRSALQSRRTIRLNIYHEPGAGGSTLARRVVWDLRNEYPCVVLSGCNPRQTLERLQRIFSLSGNPVVVLTEGSELLAQQSDELANLLASRNIPSVMIQVIRKFAKPHSLSGHSFYLSASLTEGESQRFAMTLARDVPERQAEIRNVITSGVGVTPFYMCLVAYESDFVSLPLYVERYLGCLTDVQKMAVVYLSLAYYYGQKSIDAQVFASLFSLPPNKIVDFESLFVGFTSKLIVKSERNSWRPVHYLVAEEILIQHLSSGSDDNRQWRNGLCDLAIEFAQFCSDCDENQWGVVEDIVRHVFVDRVDEISLNANQHANKYFAKIVSDVPSDEARLRMFVRLTELFPQDHHLWAHLGRLYSHAFKNHQKALEVLDIAIGLSGDDHLVHHVKGMILRKWVYDVMSQRGEFEIVIDLAKQSADCFKMCRDMSPQDEYGFISEIQLLLKVVEYVSKVNSMPSIDAVSRSQDVWLVEIFDRIEILLDELSFVRQNNEASEYEEHCRADLSRLYGDHSSALQTWQNLIDRKNVYAPPVRRQIIRTILDKHNNDWSQLNGHEIKRSFELLKHNMTEEANDGRNMRLWLRALRYSKVPVDLDEIIERVGYWNTSSDTIDSAFYLYVLYTIQAVDGYALSVDRAMNALEKCKTKARYRRDRTKGIEWLGQELGLKGLINKDALGQWNQQRNFWEVTRMLRRVRGIISRINGQESGLVEVNGIKAFFVPGVSGHSFGRSENMPVTFFLAFSYDGPRAWSVENA